MNNQTPFVQHYQASVKEKQYSTFTAEIIDIVLDEKHSLFNTNHSIGMVQFRSYYGGINGYAFPLDGYSYVTPLLHESVLIVQGTNFNAGTVNESLVYYYMTPINIWNIINCNLAPYSTRDINNSKPPKSSEYSTFTGNTSVDITKTVTYGNYFKEKLYIPRIKPFEGDIIYQGRWGQSIRFGSIVKQGLNSWSSKGELGTPLTIIRVNQVKTDNINDITVEDVNKDSSSIYICDNINIPLELSSNNNNSYKYKNSSKALIDPKNFIGKQLLFNSDRIILNAKQDGIILSAKKTIHLTSNESVNIDSKTEVILDAPEIALGSNAKSPATLGNETVTIFKDITKEMADLCKTIATINTIGSPTAQALNPTLITQFTNAAVKFAQIATKLDTILSKKIILE